MQANQRTANDQTCGVQSLGAKERWKLGEGNRSNDCSEENHRAQP